MNLVLPIYIWPIYRLLRSASLLGTAYECYWRNTTVIVYALGTGPTLRPGNPLVVVADRLRLYAYSTDYNEQHTVVTTTRPENALDVRFIQPYAQIQGPTIVSFCEKDLDFEAFTLSTGHMGRKWLYKWDVMDVVNTTAAMTQEAKNWLNIPLQEKIHRVILRGLINISDTP